MHSIQRRCEGERYLLLESRVCWSWSAKWKRLCLSVDRVDLMRLSNGGVSFSQFERRSESCFAMGQDFVWILLIVGTGMLQLWLY